MPKNIQCLSCANVIAIATDDNKIVITDMKALSRLEIDTNTNEKNLKCRCGTWNHFDKNEAQTINYKRKSEDAMYFVSGKKH